MTEAFFVKGLDSLTEKALSVLLSAIPEERRQKALKFKHLSGKILSAASFALLILALKRTGLHEGELLLTEGAHGKPLPADGSFFFNISHTNGAVAAVVSTSPVGIDIQKIIEKDINGIMKKVCPKNEQTMILSSSCPKETMTMLWTLKESYLKYTGEGIAGLERLPDFSKLSDNGCGSGNTLFEGTVSFDGAAHPTLTFSTLKTDDYYLSVCSGESVIINELPLEELLSQ